MSPIESQRLMLGKMMEMQQLAASDRIEPNIIPNENVNIGTG